MKTKFSLHYSEKPGFVGIEYNAEIKLYKSSPDNFDYFKKEYIPVTSSVASKQCRLSVFDHPVALTPTTNYLRHEDLYLFLENAEDQNIFKKLFAEKPAQVLKLLDEISQGHIPQSSAEFNSEEIHLCQRFHQNLWDKVNRALPIAVVSDFDETLTTENTFHRYEEYSSQSPVKRQGECTQEEKMQLEKNSDFLLRHPQLTKEFFAALAKRQDIVLMIGSRNYAARVREYLKHWDLDKVFPLVYGRLLPNDDCYRCAMNLLNSASAKSIFVAQYWINDTASVIGPDNIINANLLLQGQNQDGKRCIIAVHSWSLLDDDEVHSKGDPSVSGVHFSLMAKPNSLDQYSDRVEYIKSLKKFADQLECGEALEVLERHQASGPKQKSIELSIDATGEKEYAEGTGGKASNPSFFANREERSLAPSTSTWLPRAPSNHGYY